MQPKFSIPGFEVDPQEIARNRREAAEQKNMRRNKIPASSEKAAIANRLKTIADTFFVAKAKVDDSIEMIQIPQYAVQAFELKYPKIPFQEVDLLHSIAARLEVTAAMGEFIETHISTYISINRRNIKLQVINSDEYIFTELDGAENKLILNSYKDVSQLITEQRVKELLLTTYLYFQDVINWIVHPRNQGEKMTRMVRAVPNRDLIDSIVATFYPLSRAYATIMADNETANPTYSQIVETARKIAAIDSKL